MEKSRGAAHYPPSVEPCATGPWGFLYYQEKILVCTVTTQRDKDGEFRDLKGHQLAPVTFC